mmetsp:Transcript_264/g.930  ORF Transcript_264/g.930 Transcript_264/m.930 type:complete len:103 (-) Transcript_264:1970-2278(-)
MGNVVEKSGGLTRACPEGSLVVLSKGLRYCRRISNLATLQSGLSRKCRPYLKINTFVHKGRVAYAFGQPSLIRLGCYKAKQSASMVVSFYTHHLQRDQGKLN